MKGFVEGIIIEQVGDYHLVISDFYDLPSSFYPNAANDFSITATVFSISSSVWARDMNPASNWEGARYTPWQSIVEK
jgi:hypothetical protein